MRNRAARIRESHDAEVFISFFLLLFLIDPATPFLHVSCCSTPGEIKCNEGIVRDMGRDFVLLTKTEVGS
jgi:hypothetical protein